MRHSNLQPPPPHSQVSIGPSYDEVSRHITTEHRLTVLEEFQDDQEHDFNPSIKQRLKWLERIVQAIAYIVATLMLKLLDKNTDIAALLIKRLIGL